MLIRIAITVIVLLVVAFIGYSLFLYVRGNALNELSRTLRKNRIRVAAIDLDFATGRITEEQRQEKIAEIVSANLAAIEQVRQELVGSIEH